MKRDYPLLFVKVSTWTALVIWSGAIVTSCLGLDNDPDINNLVIVATLGSLFGPMVILTLYYAWKEWKGQR